MTTGSMQEVQRSKSGQTGSEGSFQKTIRSWDVSQIGSILLSDGLWHDVSNCEKIDFAISTSPVDRYYPYLQYTDDTLGTQVVSPFRNIQAFSKDKVGSKSNSSTSS